MSSWTAGGNFALGIVTALVGSFVALMKFGEDGFEIKRGILCK